MSREIFFVLDETGSMWDQVEQAVTGFNDFLVEQVAFFGKRKKVQFNLSLFSETANEDIFRDVVVETPLKEVNAMRQKEYDPRGRTPLYDALGRTIEIAKSRNKKKDEVVIAVVTDGQENASSEYSSEQITALVKECQEDLGWKIIFIGSNADAMYGKDYSKYAQQTMGVNRAATYSIDNIMAKGGGGGGGMSAGVTFASQATQDYFKDSDEKKT